jgi:hypothetical protein
MQEKLAEESSVGEMQIRITGSRPTLEKLRIEAEAAAVRRRRRVLVTRIASAVVVVSLALIAYALLAR